MFLKKINGSENVYFDNFSMIKANNIPPPQKKTDNYVFTFRFMVEVQFYLSTKSTQR